MSGPLSGAPDVPATSHPLFRFAPCSGRLLLDWWVSPSNPKHWHAHDNRVTHFGYGGNIPRCRGMVCEEQERRVNIYITLYCILQGPWVSPRRFLTPWGLENNRALLRTPASAYISTIAFPLSSWHLRKSGQASKNGERKNYG
jgi:hypothetical protein